MTDKHDELHPGEENESPAAGFMTDTLTIDTGVAEVPDEHDGQERCHERGEREPQDHGEAVLT